MFRLLQFFCFFFALLSFGWSITSHQLRDAEGLLEGSFCLPVSIGIALAILGSAVTSRYKRPAFWFSLALVGQAVALQLINAGPGVRYQHYKLITHLKDVHPLLLIFLVVQTFIVLNGFSTIWPKIRNWIRNTFQIWQIVCISIIFFISSATLSPKVTKYVTELFFAAYIQAMNLGCIIVMVWTFPKDILGTWKQKLEEFFGRPDNGSINETQSKTLDRFSIIAAIWVTGIASLLCYFSYERHPHVPDEVSYLYHARYLAKGMLTMQAPPVTEAFDIDLMYYEGDRWFTPSPPGWPFVLSIGTFFGIPWLVNPILAGVNVILTYILIKALFDRRTARFVVFLLSLSPWYVFMGMNFMTHTVSLSFALFSSIAVVMSRKTGKALWAWTSGFSLGMISLIRPLEALIMAGVLGLWSIGIGGKRLKLKSIGALILGTIAIGSLALFYNKLLTDDYGLFPIMAYTQKYYPNYSNALGFGPDRGLGWRGLDPFPGHGLIDIFINANLNVFSLNIELFGWCTGSLLLAAIMVCSRKMQKTDYLMLIVVFVIIGMHSFYWFGGGPDFGARYWYLCIIPCTVLTVRGMQTISHMIEDGPVQKSVKSTCVVIAVLSLCFISFVNYFPWRAIDKYFHYRGMRPDVRSLAKKHDFGKSLVLISGDRHPDYASAAIYNPIELNADVPVYAWDRNPESRSKVLKAYIDRPVWIINGPTITGSSYSVVTGPLSAQELLKKR